MAAGALLGGAGPLDGTVTIAVGNVRNASGRVHVDLCRRAEFLKDCLRSAEAPAASPVTTLMLHDVPAGDYAVQATHDENANGKVDRVLFGIPKEGVGFSRDARIGLGPPKWEDAVVAFDGRQAHLALRLRYFIGASGPAQAR